MNGRPNFSQQINITPEMEHSFNQMKSNLIKHRIAITMIIFGTMGTFLGVTEKIVGILGIFSLFIGICLFVNCRKYAYIKKNYIEECLHPLIANISPNVEIKKDFDYFPLYGNITPSYEDMLYAKNIRVGKTYDEFTTDNAEWTYHRDLGLFLKEKRVIPNFQTNFKNDFVVDTLQDNEEGFLFSNADANTITYGAKGRKIIHTKFKGPLVVIKISNNVRSGVSIFTTKTSKILKIEQNNNYLKVDTIDTENSEFNENFEVASDNDSQAFFVLSPLVMEKLLSIKERYGNFGVYIDGHYIVLGMNTKSTLLSIPDKLRDMNKMSIERTYNELVELLTMIYDFKDAIDLNNNY